MSKFVSSKHRQDPINHFQDKIPRQHARFLNLVLYKTRQMLDMQDIKFGSWMDLVERNIVSVKERLDKIEKIVKRRLL